VTHRLVSREAVEAIASYGRSFLSVTLPASRGRLPHDPPLDGLLGCVG
jgi:hypothetical protein